MSVGYVSRGRRRRPFSLGHRVADIRTNQAFGILQAPFISAYASLVSAHRYGKARAPMKFALGAPRSGVNLSFPFLTSLTALRVAGGIRWRGLYCTPAGAPMIRLLSLFTTSLAAQACE